MTHSDLNLIMKSQNALSDLRKHTSYQHHNYDYRQFINLLKTVNVTL